MIVIGAGIIGLSCAWRLAQQGVKVRLFDAKLAASDASWASAGMLAPGSEMDGPREFAELGVRSASAWPAFVEELQRETGLLIDYRACGAHEFVTADIIRRRKEHLAGLDVRVLEKDGYWEYPDDAIVDPRDVCRALLAACQKRGVELHQREPVLEIAGAGTSVRSAGGEYRAQGVLITAGARSSELFPGLPRTMPVRGHLVSWLLEPGALPVILRQGHTYILQRSSGLIVAGSTTEHAGFDPTLDPNLLADLRSRAVQLFPRLAGLDPTEQWVGFRPAIDAPGPRIGPIAGTSVWTAFGHYRNGILMAPETARLIAEAAAPLFHTVSADIR